MRWMPLQNFHSKKWVLSVMHDDCMSYDVTDLESDSIDKILYYVDFMNNGVCDGIDPETLERLNQLKGQYENIAVSGSGT